MTPAFASAPTDVATSSRSHQLADRLERNAGELLAFARSLTEEQWRMPVPGDGRPVGVVVDHVASVYPIEIELAQLMASGAPIADVTWAGIAAMNAAHAAERSGTSKEETLARLQVNSARAAAAIRAMSEEDLSRAVTVSLYAGAELTSQFMLEDHAVRHSLHHLAKVRAMFKG